MLNLKPLKRNHREEPVSVYFNKELVRASLFGQMEFQSVLQHVALLSRNEIVRVMNAYADAKMIFGYSETNRRSTGERYFEHVKGAALIDMLEFGNKDFEIIIAELHHDSKEDSLLFRGNENHPRRRQSHLLIDSFSRLAARYGERVAKIIECVTKPDKKGRMNSQQKELYLHAALGRVISLYPEVRRESAQVKTCDAIHNNRTQKGSEEQIAEKTIEKWRFYLPVSRFAGEIYYDKLRSELKERLLQLELRVPPEHDFGIV